MANFFDTSRSARFNDEKMKKVNLFESPRMFCDVYCLKPGQSQKEHTHEANDKIYHCVTGVVTVRVGEETRTLRPGELAVCPAGVIHGIRNDSAENATALVIMSPHPNYKG
jgi:quercetin dioxygenase-like cupin family protein